MLPPVTTAPALISKVRSDEGVLMSVTIAVFTVPTGVDVAGGTGADTVTVPAWATAQEAATIAVVISKEARR
jgi:hypothetical protein